MSEVKFVGNSTGLQTAEASVSAEASTTATTTETTTDQTAEVSAGDATTSNGAEQTQSGETLQGTDQNSDESMDEIVLDFGDNVQGQEQQGGEQTTTTSVSWEDAIKTVDKKQVLAKIGLDENTVQIAEYLANNGDIYELIENKLVDWNKVPVERLAFEGLRKDYPSLSESDLTILFQRRFNQHEDADDDAKAYGTVEMKAYAERVLQQKIEQQNKFKIPEVGKTKAQTEWEQQQEAARVEAQQAEEKYRQFFNEHEATKNLLQSKRVAVPLGDGRNFNFPVGNPESLIKLMTDGETWQKVVTTPQGEPDVAKLQLISLFSLNPQKFIQDVYNSGKSFGVKSVVEEGQNAKRPTGGQPPSATNQQQVVIKNTNGRGLSVRQ